MRGSGSQDNEHSVLPPKLSLVYSVDKENKNQVFQGNQGTCPQSTCVHQGQLAFAIKTLPCNKKGPVPYHGIIKTETGLWRWTGKVDRQPGKTTLTKNPDHSLKTDQAPEDSQHAGFFTGSMPSKGRVCQEQEKA